MAPEKEGAGVGTSPASFAPVSEAASWAGVVLAAAAFATLLFGGLSHPLMWNDEAYTAVYAERVLEHGYPRVYGPRNVVYALDAPVHVGVKEGSGAYIGSPWGQYYFAALGVSAARGTSDPYRKTALIRLPFAVAGCAGVLFFLSAALSLLGRDRRTRLGVAFVFLSLCALSISLILHLREVRYYALVVFFAGWIVWLQSRGETGPSGSRVGREVALVFALLGLFVSYYPAFVAFGTALALDAAWAAWTRPAQPAFRVRALGRSLAPLGVAAGLALPAALFLEIPRVVSALQAGYDASLAAYLRNLGIVGANLLRFEFLAPVLAVKLWLAALRWKGPAEPRCENARRLRRFSGFLTLLLGVYWLVVARTPFIFERYFVALSPLLITLLLVDARRAILRLHGGASKWAWAPAAVVVLCLLAAGFARIPELRGRVAELRTPVRGPLDAVIPYLQERYRDPGGLVIATNYEGPAYVYYLGSQVIVGFNAPALERDMKLTPDVIVPRSWRKSLEPLRALLREGDYRRKLFPIEGSPTNNIPSLSPHTPGGLVHRFATRLATDPRSQVVIYERASAGERD